MLRKSVVPKKITNDLPTTYLKKVITALGYKIISVVSSDGEITIKVKEDNIKLN
jgi:hypothetical protein